jgi:L-alanine-DL-glutamate epimerase-like enolase superfamily enzyme
MLNIKLGKSSGFLRAKKIVQMASHAGLHLQVGGFMESRLGMTAAAHLALLHDAIVHYDLDTPLMFTEDPVEGGVIYGERGMVEVPEVVGLGAIVEKEYLKESERVLV